jgi:putative Mn2+ efflux pump MntP
VESLPFDIGQILTILVMAMALGMDAFSLGIGIGMRGIRLLDILKISVIVGFFHIVMPLMGMVMGHYVSTLIGDIAILLGGGLLILLGSHMIYSSLQGEAVDTFNYSSVWGLLVFALSVSIDSFSVGVSFGLFASDVILSVLMFGIFGGMMSIMGLLLGRRISSMLGAYGEAVGGIILLIFGFKFIV